MSTTLIREPDTLPELQSMSTDEIRRVDAYQHGDGIATSKFMRGVIRLADKERSWQGIEKADSVRGFWYNPVKPIAQKAKPEYVNSDKVDESFTEHMAGNLSRYLSNMVKNKSNGITYQGLNIYDESRERSIETTGIESDKILLAEKDVAYRKVKSLSETYELSVVSGGGYSSTAAIEAIANELNPHKNYRLFVMSDYDPSGFEIVEDFHSRARQMGINIVDIERVAVNPEQVDGKTISEQKYELPSDDQSWNGAIDGKYGLELEAIGAGSEAGRKLRKIVVDEIQPNIRETERYSRELSNATTNMMDKVPNELAHRTIEEWYGDVQRKIWKRIDEEAHEIMEDSDVFKSSEDGGYKIDWEEAQKSDDPLIPEAPDKGDLHQAAVNGNNFNVSGRTAEKELRTRLEAKIESGEIDIDGIILG